MEIYNKSFVIYLLNFSNTEVKNKTIILGAYDLTSTTETWRKEYPVKTIVSHNTANTLVEFDGVDFTLNPKLKPICLPETESTDGTLIAASWVYIYSDNLKKHFI